LNKKIRFFLFILVSMVCALVVLTFVPNIDRPSIYFAVDKRSGHFEEGRDWVSSSRLGLSSLEYFLVFNGRLYLRIQTDDSSLLMTVKKQKIGILIAFKNLKMSMRS
jgi:hypothetical protein